MKDDITKYINGLGVSDPLYKEWIKKYNKTKRNDREFLSDEYILSAMLGSVVAQKSDEILAFFEPVFAGELAQLDTAVGASSNLTKDMIDSNAEKLIYKQYEKIIDKGVVLGGAFKGALNEVPTRLNILEGSVSSAKYYTNNYFNRMVMPQITSLIDKMIDNPSLMTDDSFKLIRSKMENRLKSVPYWRVVANNSASRAYTYGTVKVAQLNGRTKYSLKATRDEVTSDICEYLDGREFWIADAVTTVEKIVMSTSPDDVREISPWRKVDDVKADSQQDLIDNGTMIPPFHGNCRTVIVPN